MRYKIALALFHLFLLSSVIFAKSDLMSIEIEGNANFYNVLVKAKVDGEAVLKVYRDEQIILTSHLKYNRFVYNKEIANIVKIPRVPDDTKPDYTPPYPIPRQEKIFQFSADQKTYIYKAELIIDKKIADSKTITYRTKKNLEVQSPPTLPKKSFAPYFISSSNLPNEEINHSLISLTLGLETKNNYFDGSVFEELVNNENMLRKQNGDGWISLMVPPKDQVEDRTPLLKSLIESLKLNRLEINFSKSSLASLTETSLKMDEETVNRWNQAILKIQKSYPKLHISYAIPISSDPNIDSLFILKEALQAGVRIDTSNFLTFVHPNENVSEQVRTLITQRTADLKPRKDGEIGITPILRAMNTSIQKPSISDIKKILSFANEKNINFLSLWDLTEDEGDNYEYTKILLPFSTNNAGHFKSSSSNTEPKSQPQQFSQKEPPPFTELPKVSDGNKTPDMYYLPVEP